MSKQCLFLRTSIPNFVAFFESLRVVIFCIRKMSFSVTSAKQEFTPAIVSLSTSQEALSISIFKLGDAGISSNLIGSLSLANARLSQAVLDTISLGLWLLHTIGSIALS